MATKIRLLRTKEFTSTTELGGRQRNTKMLMFKYYADYYSMMDDYCIWKTIYTLKILVDQTGAFSHEINGISTTPNEGLRLNQGLLMNEFRAFYKKALGVEEPTKSQIIAKGTIFSLALIQVQEEMIKRKIFFFDRYTMSDN